MIPISWVATIVKDDDLGPHTLEEVNQTYSILSAQFPNAKIIPTNLTEIQMRSTFTAPLCRC